MVDFIVPWISPELENGLLRSFITASGKRAVFGKNEIIATEYEYHNKIYFVHSGCITTSITHYELNKPFLISNICGHSSICGYSPFMLKTPENSRIVSLCTTEASCLTFRRLESFFSENGSSYREFLQYCGYCKQSEINSMLTMLTLPAEEKFWILIGAIALHYNIDTDGQWFPIPFKITRQILSGLLYVSSITIDRLVAGLFKRKYLHKQDKEMYFRSSEVQKGIGWIKNHNLHTAADYTHKFQLTGQSVQSETCLTNNVSPPYKNGGKLLST